jgi:hypothetical protein
MILSTPPKMTVPFILARRIYRGKKKKGLLWPVKIELKTRAPMVPSAVDDG